MKTFFLNPIRRPACHCEAQAGRLNRTSCILHRVSNTHYPSIVNHQTTIINPLLRHLKDQGHGPSAHNTVFIQAEVPLESYHFLEGLLVKDTVLFNQVSYSV